MSNFDHNRNCPVNHASLEGSALESARVCTAQCNYGRAFANYLVVLKLNPGFRHEIKDDFVYVMKEWADELEREMRLVDLFKCYDLACELFPDCDGMLNNIGAQLFRMGYKDEGACYVRRALRINPTFLAARQNFENICSHLVERWHFRMLNDAIRNETFYRAIGLAVLEGYDTVLDIGSGTGLLSMFAVSQGAKRVTACEQSKTMLMISQEALTASHMIDRVTVIGKTSTDLVVPTDLSRVSLIVTETFDAGLFGEHILTTLKHAWNELLLPPKNGIPQSVVIPQKATLHVVAVEADAILKRNRFMYPSLKTLEMGSVVIKCDTMDDPDEPYTTETLNELNGGHRRLTPSIPFMTVDFNDIQNIENLISGYTHTFNLTVTDKGRVDALVMWFDLQLIHDVHLSTSPDIPNCWQQAVFPVFDQGNRRSMTANVGQRIRITCTCNDDKISLTCVGVCDDASSCEMTDGSQSSDGSDGPTRSVANDDSADALGMIEDALEKTHVQPSADGENVTLLRNGCEVHSERGGECVPANSDGHAVSRKNVDKFSDVSVANCSNSNRESCVDKCRVNSRDGTERISKSVEVNADKMASPSHKLSALSHACSRSVVDKTFAFSRDDIAQLNNVKLNSTYCEVLASFAKNKSTAELRVADVTRGLSALGLQAVQLGFTQAAICGCDDNVKAFLRHLMSINDIEEDRVLLEDGDALTSTDKKFEVIVAEIIEPCGLLRQQILEDLDMYRELVLSVGGAILPSGFTVYGLCIESHDLISQSQVVGDAATVGFKVAEFINDYQMTTHVGIQLSTLTHSKLTEPFLMAKVDLNEQPADLDLPTFLDLERDVVVKVTESGHLAAVVFWFEVTVWEGRKVCTYDPASHWKQAAVMIPGDMILSAGEELSVTCRLKNSCIDITVNGITD